LAFWSFAALLLPATESKSLLLAELIKFHIKILCTQWFSRISANNWPISSWNKYLALESILSIFLQMMPSSLFLPLFFLQWYFRI
jgi:hypothetical protein